MTSSSRRGGAGRRKPGELESAILAVLWSSDHLMSPGEVNDAMGSGLAYATVSTTLLRLAEKGQLRRTTVGRTHRYEPAVARSEHVSGIVRQLLALGDRAEVLQGMLDGLSRDDERVLADLLTEAGDADPDETGP
jgi:predicted transcriptional regulator